MPGEVASSGRPRWKRSCAGAFGRMRGVARLVLRWAAESTPWPRRNVVTASALVPREWLQQLPGLCLAGLHLWVLDTRDFDGGSLTVPSVEANLDGLDYLVGKAVTEVVPAGDFWEAEPEHQDYLLRNPGGYTCHYMRD